MLTIDRLIQILRTEETDDAGMRAVVRALRDEIVPDGEWWDHADIKGRFNEILGDAGAEKVAGGSTREDEQSCNSSDGSSPATDFATHLARQRDFSERTFGPGERVEGVSDHIRKELLEVAKASPGEERQAEWIDVVMLALDGAWRSGMSPEQIIQGLRDKLEKNERRTWPDWRTADPNKAIEHDSAADAAPAVCVWTGDVQLGDAYMTKCRRVVSKRWAEGRNHCSCGKPITFTEANHG